MNDDIRLVHDITCPRCPDYRVVGLWPRQLVDLEVELHTRGHADEDAEQGLTCDPPRVPLPRTRDLTLTGITEAVARAVWRWVR